MKDWIEILTDSFPIIRFSTVGKEERSAKKAHDIAYNAGKEDGKREILAQIISYSRDLTESEHRDLINYLVTNHLVIIL